PWNPAPAIAWVMVLVFEKSAMYQTAAGGSPSFAVMISWTYGVGSVMGWSAGRTGISATMSKPASSMAPAMFSMPRRADSVSLPTRTMVLSVSPSSGWKVTLALLGYSPIVGTWQ